MFSTSAFDIGCTNLGYHDICTENADPVARRPYRLAHSEKPVAEQLIQDMLKHGIIEEAQSSLVSRGCLQSPIYRPSLIDMTTLTFSFLKLYFPGITPSTGINIAGKC